jgi:uncharacterized membrane protein HdeD (DUF308 family)
MPHKLCKVAGFALIAVGLIGFVSPHLLGMHLTLVHNVVHLLSGAAALYFGFANPGGARGFALAFGSVYLLLGVLGFVSPDLFARIIGHGGGEARDFLADNIVHVVIGGTFLATALASAPSKTPVGFGR